MKTLLLCTLALLLTAGSCKKNTENQLPPATQTGANTFGCYVNGALYSMSGEVVNPRGPIADPGVMATVTAYNFAIIKMIANDHRSFYITFNFQNNKLIAGTYTTGLTFSYSDFLDPEKESKVVVTKYDGKILSGTFEMYFLDKFDNKKKYALTDGRFDIQLEN